MTQVAAIIIDPSQESKNLNNRSEEMHHEMRISPEKHQKLFLTMLVIVWAMLVVNLGAFFILEITASSNIHSGADEMRDDYLSSGTISVCPTKQSASRDEDSSAR